MAFVDVDCPVCRKLNIQVDLEETNGWMVCSHCGAEVVPTGYVHKVMKCQTFPLNIPEFTLDTVKNVLNH